MNTTSSAIRTSTVAQSLRFVASSQALTRSRIACSSVFLSRGLPVLLIYAPKGRVGIFPGILIVDRPLQCTSVPGKTSAILFRVPRDAWIFIFQMIAKHTNKSAGDMTQINGSHLRIRNVQTQRSAPRLTQLLNSASPLSPERATGQELRGADSGAPVLNATSFRTILKWKTNQATVWVDTNSYSACRIL